MIFAFLAALCNQRNLCDESNPTLLNNGTFIGAPLTNASVSSSNHTTHNNNNSAGKLKILTQKPCFKFIAGALALGGIVAYSVFANTCNYRLNCEEIHPYIVFLPVSYGKISLKH